MQNFEYSQLLRELSFDDMARNALTRKAKKLGEANKPDTSAKQISGEEKKLLENIVAKYSSWRGSVQKEMDRIRSESNDLISGLEITLTQEEEGADRKLEQKKKKVESAFGERSAKFDFWKNRVIESEQELNAVKNSVGNRPLEIKFENFYLPFMGALALAEVWVNRLAFELFFESSPLISFFLAVSVGAMLVFFAHVTGEFSKRISSQDYENKVMQTLSGLLLLNSIVLVFIYYLGKMRQAFVALDDVAGAGLNLTPLLDDPVSAPLTDLVSNESALDSLLGASLGEEGIFLLLINMTIYICGAVASFMRHDSHPVYEKITKKHNKNLNVLLSLRKKYEDELLEIDDTRVASSNEMLEKRQKFESEMRSLNEQRDKLERELAQTKATCKKAAREILEHFRENNRESRSTAAPRYFDDYSLIGEIFDAEE